MVDTRFTAFLGVALLLTARPGADMALSLRQALAYGRRSALQTVARVRAGLCVHAALSVLGLSATLARPDFLATVHIAMGVAWLVRYVGLLDRFAAFLTRTGLRRLERLTGAVPIGLGLHLTRERR